MAKGSAAAAAKVAASEVTSVADKGIGRVRYRNELPEGREVTKVKLAAGSVPLVGFHVTHGLDATRDIRMVLSGPLLFVERIMPGAAGKRVRKLGAVPVTGILSISFQDEPAIEPE